MLISLSFSAQVPLIIIKMYLVALIETSLIMFTFIKYKEMRQPPGVISFLIILEFKGFNIRHFIK